MGSQRVRHDLVTEQWTPWYATLEEVWLRKVHKFLPKSMSRYYITEICCWEDVTLYLSLLESLRTESQILGDIWMYEAPGQRLGCTSSVDCDGNCPEHTHTINGRRKNCDLSNSSSFVNLCSLIPHLILPSLYGRSNLLKNELDQVNIVSVIFFGFNAK